MTRSLVYRLLFPSPRVVALRLGVVAVVLAAGAGAWAVFADEIDILDRRLFRARDRYDFDEIRPRFRQVDPASLISVRTPEAAAALREKLVRIVWGDTGLPLGARPNPPQPIPTPRALAGAANLGGTRHAFIPLALGLRGEMYELLPAHGSGRTVIYHHGYAGTVFESAPTLRALVAAGHRVLALNLVGYGGSRHIVTQRRADGSVERVNIHDKGLVLLDHPLQYHLTPIIAAVNYALATGAPGYVDAVGLSAGAWTVAMAAASDTRIRASYPVGGIYPMYLREGQELRPQPHVWPGLVGQVEYLDLFVLAAAEPGRRQTQIFNRYDRCCYRNLKGLLYHAAVRAAVAQVTGGNFEVVIDESHAGHKISRRAIALILEGLGRASGPHEGARR